MPTEKKQTKKKVAKKKVVKKKTTKKATKKSIPKKTTKELAVEPVEKLTAGITLNTITKTSSYNSLLIAGFVAAIIAMVASLVFTVNSQLQINDLQDKLQDAQNNPLVQSQQTNQDLVTEIGNLIVLPETEEPTIATVSDLAKLSEEPFFKNAQLGDKVLIYTLEQKAILYRPSTKQIIELAPLNTGAQSINTSR